MLDFNHGSGALSDRLNHLLDTALEARERAEPKRDYLGGSRLGVSCKRALQFECTRTPKDPGREFSGRTLRIFAAGHLFEAQAVEWLRLAGFSLTTEQPNGEQFGFSTAGGRIAGHIDGFLTAGPAGTGMGFPALWECKSLNDRSWKETVKRGVAVSKPVYAAQIALYQAYMEPQIPGISRNPALFTAINKNTSEIHHERVPFNADLAQRMSDKGVAILLATEAGEWLPRIGQDRSWHECRLCDWQDRCWSMDR